MKLEIKQNILIEHLNYVIKGISNKNIIPVLNCIKFELEEEGLYLTSTDNEIAIKTFIDKKDIENIEKCGIIVVSGRFIYDIIKKLPNSLVKIEEVLDNKIYITTNTSSFNLNCNDPSEFPDIDLSDTKNPVFISKKVFKNIIKQTSFAASLQESRPILTGINFKIDNNILECTATDSYRLARKRIEIESNLDNEVNIVIPNKNVNEIVKLLNDDEEKIELHIFNNKVIFKFNSIIIMSRLINGTYPDTSKLIPDSFSIHINVNLFDFIDAIDRASLLTNESDKNTIKLVSNNKQIIISSSIPEIGNVEEKIEIIKRDDEDISISFSSKYMMDAIKSFECNEIELLFNDEIHPIIVKNTESDDLIQLILPIRTY
ncbi:MAG: DNA polymerase III subunit beta [Bacilli bacterium]|nr:DNA polymerase III subunit beta [Bacilli bacterium]